SERRAGERAAATEGAQPRCDRRREHGHGDREPYREEREERIERERVLDLDERHAPDRGDEDECKQRPDRATLLRQAVSSLWPSSPSCGWSCVSHGVSSLPPRSASSSEGACSCSRSTSDM